MRPRKVMVGVQPRTFGQERGEKKLTSWLAEGLGPPGADGALRAFGEEWRNKEQPGQESKIPKLPQTLLEFWRDNQRQLREGLAEFSWPESAKSKEAQENQEPCKNTAVEVQMPHKKSQTEGFPAPSVEGTDGTDP